MLAQPEQQKAFFCWSKRMRILLLSRLLRAVRLGYVTENQLTVKAWEKAVQELGNFETTHGIILSPLNADTGF